MASILLLLTMIAATPSEMIMVENMMMAIQTTQTSYDREAVRSAAEQDKRIFTGYIAFLLVIAVLGAIGTWLVRWSGNKFQEAIRIDANARIAEAGRDIQALKTEAERERAERVRLEAQIAPRRLTSDQGQAIRNNMSVFAGRNVRVETYVLDVEGTVLGKQIISALQSADLNIEDATMSVISYGGTALGLHIAGPEQDLVNTLIASFASVGLEVAPPGSGQDRVMDRGTIQRIVTILVGVKPISN